MTQGERIKMAHHRAEELSTFYSHLTLFGGVIALLAVFDALSGGGWWFYWPMLGWSIGIAAHALTMWGHRLWGPEWEERKTADLLARAGVGPPR
jgi:hypothetical protein